MRSVPASTSGRQLLALVALMLLLGLLSVVLDALF
jgi:hypothetical protein